MLRSLGAIAAGFVFIAVLSMAAGGLVQALAPEAFDAAGRTESLPVLILSQAYVAAFAITGCWLAARLAGRAPMRHALILGALGLAFNLAMIPTTRMLLPGWYLALSIFLVMPYAWIGGRIREGQMQRAK